MEYNHQAEIIKDGCNITEKDEERFNRMFILAMASFKTISQIVECIEKRVKEDEALMRVLILKCMFPDYEGKKITEIDNTKTKAEYMIMDIYYNMFPNHTFHSIDHAYEKIIGKLKK